MKVWVPIDLPEGWRVTSVVMHNVATAEFHGVAPVGPVRREEELVVAQPEPQRERWEYTSLDKGADLYPLAKAVGKDGWEMFWLADDRAWFKRRLP